MSADQTGFALLTQNQIDTIARATHEELPDADNAFLLRVLRHVDTALMESALIENVCAGSAAIVAFAPDGEPQFRITAAGKRDVEERLLPQMDPSAGQRKPGGAS